MQSTHRGIVILILARGEKQLFVASTSPKSQDKVTAWLQDYLKCWDVQPKRTYMYIIRGVDLGQTTHSQLNYVVGLQVHVSVTIMNPFIGYQLHEVSSPDKLSTLSVSSAGLLKSGITGKVRLLRDSTKYVNIENLILELQFSL